MKYKIAIAVALIPLCILLMGFSCSSSTNTQVVTISEIKLGLNAFITAEKIANPGWNPSVLQTDLQTIVNDWQIGANWETNVINALDQFETDASTIPGCSEACQLAVLGVDAGIESYIIYVSSQTPAPSILAHAAGKKAKYTRWVDYKADWNEKMTQLSLQNPAYKKAMLK